MKFATIERVQQKETEKMDKENIGGTDLINAIPSSITRTY
jgi:hypothetical protein